MVEENIKETEGKKDWQPVNIIFGLLIIGFIFYSCLSKSAPLAIIRLIPAIILIFTRRNNIFVSLVLFIFGLTIFIFPTLDAFLLLSAAVYMFFSALLRMFKVKYYMMIGLVIALVVSGWLFFKLAVERKQTFISENNVTIMREINDRVSIVLSSSPSESDLSTEFHPLQRIYPIEKGLQKGINYACRVINRSGEVVIPLDKWPVFKSHDNVEQKGEFNNGNYLPLDFGEYKIQLVKIENSKGIIIAENNFSIVPYSEEELSRIVAYLTSDNDPGQKSYDSYTVKTQTFGVKAWVQAPKGKAISGKLKFYKTDRNGVVEKTPWDREDIFTTPSDGEPYYVKGISGRIPPGIYHFQIIINNKVFKDLKLIIE